MQLSLSHLINTAFELYSEKIAIRNKDKIYTYEDLADKTKKYTNYFVSNDIYNQTIGLLIEDRFEEICLQLAISMSGNKFLLIPQDQISIAPALILEASCTRMIYATSNPANLKKIKNVIISPLIELKVHEIIHTEPIIQNGNFAVIFTKNRKDHIRTINFKQEHFLAEIIRTIKKHNFSDSDIVLHFQMNYEITAIKSLLTSLLSGACLIIDEITEDTAHFLESKKITKAFFNTNTFKNILKSSKTGFHSCNIQQMFIDEFSMRLSEIEKFKELFNKNVELINNFTLPETFTISENIITNDRGTYKTLTSAGNIIPTKEVYISDNEGHKLDAGSKGEIIVRSTLMPSAYINEPKKADQEFIKLIGNYTDFKSGKLGYIDDNGFLYCTGNIDREIEKKGFSFNLDMLENQLLENEMIEDVIVVFNNENEEITAFIKPNQTTTELELEEQIKACIPEFMVPDRIIFSDDLPKSLHGIVNTDALEKEFETETV